MRQCAESVVGEGAVDGGQLVMASDDMSLFLRARPGCYFRVGIKPTHGRPAPHHAPEFEMNEDGLVGGARRRAQRDARARSSRRRADAGSFRRGARRAWPERARARRPQAYCGAGPGSEQEERFPRLHSSYSFLRSTQAWYAS